MNAVVWSTPFRPYPLNIHLTLRIRTARYLFVSERLTLAQAVDLAQRYAEDLGAVESFGQDEVQRRIAEAFATLELEPC